MPIKLAGKSVRTTFSFPRARGAIHSTFPRASNCFPCLAVGSSTAFSFALVPQLLALGERKLQFHSSVLEIHARRDQSQTLLLGLADQFTGFFFMDEQFAAPQRGVIVDVPVFILANMAVQKPKLAIFDNPIGILQVHAPGP